ncbi:hypothetical protein ACFS07_22440 [Undibacterium arcticum]
MHPPITLNTVSALQNPAPVPKLGSGEPRDGQFQQLLSREVSDRNNNNNSDSSQHVNQGSNKVAAKETDRRASPPQPAPAAKTAAKSCDGEKKAGKTADGTDKASDAKADKNTNDAAASAIPPNAAAELLALVANLNQAAARTVTAEAKPADMDSTVTAPR